MNIELGYNFGKFLGIFLAVGYFSKKWGFEKKPERAKISLCVYVPLERKLLKDARSYLKGTNNREWYKTHPDSSGTWYIEGNIVA